MTIESTDTLFNLRTSFNTVKATVDDLGTHDNISITGGFIDGVTLGSNQPVSGIFSSLLVDTVINLTDADIIIGNDTISGNAIDDGTISNVMVELSGEPTIASHATTKLYVDGELSTKLDNNDITEYGSLLISSLNATAARGVLGLGSVATLDNTDILLVTNNLSDVNDTGVARNNLGLGDLAVLDTINNSNWNGTVLAAGNGGTGSSFVQFSGATGSIKTYNLPNTSGTILMANVENSITRQLVFTRTTLDNAPSSIPWNVSSNQTTRIVLNGNKSIQTPSNMKAGGEYVLFVEQDANGTRNVTFSSDYIFNGTLSRIPLQGSGVVSVFKFISDGSKMYHCGGNTLNYRKRFAAPVTSGSDVVCRFVDGEWHRITSTGEGTITFDIPVGESIILELLNLLNEPKDISANFGFFGTPSWSLRDLLAITRNESGEYIATVLSQGLTQ